MTQFYNTETNRWESTDVAAKRAQADANRKAEAKRVVDEIYARREASARSAAELAERMQAAADRLHGSVVAELQRMPSAAGRLGVDPALARWLHAKAADALLERAAVARVNRPFVVGGQ